MKLKKFSVVFALPIFAFTLIAQEVEEVVITGSYIKSSPTDGASPVEIIGRDEIDNLNATTIADITANIAVNSGSENNSDSFTQGSTQGTSNINLRGLGLSSTLVLSVTKNENTVPTTQMFTISHPSSAGRDYNLQYWKICLPELLELLK